MDKEYIKEFFDEVFADKYFMEEKLEESLFTDLPLSESVSINCDWDQLANNLSRLVDIDLDIQANIGIKDKFKKLLQKE